MKNFTLKELAKNVVLSIALMAVVASCAGIQTENPVGATESVVEAFPPQGDGLIANLRNYWLATQQMKREFGGLIACKLSGEPVGAFATSIGSAPTYNPSDPASFGNVAMDLNQLGTTYAGLRICGEFHTHPHEIAVVNGSSVELGGGGPSGQDVAIWYANQEYVHVLADVVGIWILTPGKEIMGCRWFTNDCHTFSLPEYMATLN